MTARERHSLALIGATGAVGEEILRVLEERRFPVATLRLFASDASEGMEVEFREEALRIETVEAERVAGCGLVFNAAPGVLEPLLPELRECGTPLVDLSGALELDPAVPLFLPGCEGSPSAAEGLPWVAVPRGVVAGLALALAPIAREAELERVTILTLESASGAGRRGLDELSEQTLHGLRAMDGEVGQPRVFPRALAFDCLPAVGEISANDDSSEEHRLRQVLRRSLGALRLCVETTRVRVPIFVGALACVHAHLAKPLAPERARAAWAATSGLRVLADAELPTPRAALALDAVTVGRIRAREDDGASLAFVLALDTLRRGAALTAVEAAEWLLDT